MSERGKRVVRVLLDRERDADVVERIERQGSITGYLRTLVRRDIHDERIDYAAMKAAELQAENAKLRELVAEICEAPILSDLQEGHGTQAEKGMVMEREYDYDKAPNSVIAAINEAALGEMLAMRKVKVQLDEGAFMPERAHDTDAGADIRTPVSFVLAARSSHTVNTGVHIQIPSNTKCDVRSKSGLNTNHDIISEGLIDEGFSGEIRVRLHNLSDEPYTFSRGDKITQIVVTPVYYPEFEKVEAVEGGERGEAGIGSTGR